MGRTCAMKDESLAGVLWDTMVYLTRNIYARLSNLRGPHRLLSQGLVQAVGVSNYGPKQMQKIHR